MSMPTDQLRLLRTRWPFVVGALCASTLITLCGSVDSEGRLDLGLISLLQAIILWIALSLLFSAGYGLGTRIGDPASKTALPCRLLDPKKLAAATGVMFLCWLPYLIALYPANYLGDTLISIGWFGSRLADAQFVVSDHNPVLTTVLFGSAAYLGKLVFHDAALSLFMFVVVQALATCFSFALCTRYMETKLGIPRAFCKACFLFFCLCPLFPVWANFIAKDTAFSWVFVIWFVFFIEIVRSRGAVLKRSKATFAWFILVCLLACLLKKLGFYILLISCVAALAWLLIRHCSTSKTEVIRLGLVSVAMIAVMVILPKIAFPLLNVEPGKSYEILSVPLQQTARYVVDHPDDITIAEEEAIDELLGIDDLADRYEYWIVDPVKFNSTESSEAYAAWAPVYIAQGLRHPSTYLESYVSLESGFASPGSSLTLQFDSSWMGDYDSSDIPEAYLRSGFFEKTSSLVESLYVWVSSLPGIDLVFRCMTYGVLIPVFFLASALVSRRRGDASALLLAVPVLLTLGGIWLSPVSSTIHGARYLLPFIYLAPLLVGMCLFPKGFRVPDASLPLSIDPSSR